MQIARITSDFKMGVISMEIRPNSIVYSIRMQIRPKSMVFSIRMEIRRKSMV